MAVAFGSISEVAVENNDTLTLAKPTGLAAGNMMIAGVYNRSATSWATPSGWTSLGANTPSSANFAVFMKVADSSDAAASNFSFTYSSDNTHESVGLLMRLTGTFTDSGNITAKKFATNNPGDSGDSFGFASDITPLADSFLVVINGATAANGSTSTTATYAIQNNNPTWTERAVANQPNGDDCVMGLATASRTETTAMGNVTIDWDSTSNLSALGLCILVVHETVSPTLTPDPVSMSFTMPSPTFTADANVTVSSVASLSATVPSPTVTQPDPTWNNVDKSSSPSWTNIDKS